MMNKSFRVINEFEGGPIQLYCGKGSAAPLDGLPYIILHSCRTQPIFEELKLTPTIESISRESVTLYNECDGEDGKECDECDYKTCPREEESEKGTGMKAVEVLEGWFIDFSKCMPWEECKCCRGTGYLKEV